MEGELTLLTFMQIHIDIGKVISTKKNETATKIHPQSPSSALGLSVKNKNHTACYRHVITLSQPLTGRTVLGRLALPEFPCLHLTQPPNMCTRSHLTSLVHYPANASQIPLACFAS